MAEEGQEEELGPVEQPQSETGEMTLLREQLEEALREKDQFRTMAQRAQADLINYKRRATDEMQETRRTANSQLLLKVLSIVDDLERALALIPEDAVAPGWLEGLQLVERNLHRILDYEGVTKIEADGQPFEPREHEAVFYEESADGDEGMVVRVIRDGYRLGDRVLRAAQVAVSKAPAPENQPEPPDSPDALEAEPTDKEEA